MGVMTFTHIEFINPEDGISWLHLAEVTIARDYYLFGALRGYDDVGLSLPRGLPHDVTAHTKRSLDRCEENLAKGSHLGWIDTRELSYAISRIKEIYSTWSPSPEIRYISSLHSARLIYWMCL